MSEERMERAHSPSPGTFHQFHILPMGTPPATIIRSQSASLQPATTVPKETPQQKNISPIDRKIEEYENEIKNLRAYKNSEHELQASRHSLKSAQTKMTKLDNHLDILHNERQKINEEVANLHKRVTTLTKDFEKLRNRMLQFEIITHELLAIKADGQEISGLNCGVCFEKYNNDSRQQACITSCYHAFCFTCINTLNPKICPKCRESFNNKQIKKIF